MNLLSCIVAMCNCKQKQSHGIFQFIVSFQIFESMKCNIDSAINLKKEMYIERGITFEEICHEFT